MVNPTIPSLIKSTPSFEAGEEEAPVYGIFKLAPQIPYPTQTAQVPWNAHETTIKWDGEWFITYEVFRDLGGAFLVVMVLIYILVVGWFKSFLVPLVMSGGQSYLRRNCRDTFKSLCRSCRILLADRS